MKYLQNKIAESRFSLPVTIVAAVALWMLTGLREEMHWLLLVFLLAGTYLMAELNNQNALMRTYSRMVSCSFVVFDLIMAPVFHDYVVGVVQLCAILCWLFLFKAYQNKRAQGYVFFAFCMLSMASLLEVGVLWFVPVLWILLGTCIMAMSMRNFLASLLGLFVPYWFVMGYDVYSGAMPRMVSHLTQLIAFSPVADLSAMSELTLITLVFFVVLTLIGTVHFLRFSYNDKIRTRMLFEIFITMSLIIVVLLIVQPHSYSILTALLIVNMSPLVAHTITFTRSRLSNIMFALFSVCGLVLLFCNLLWQP